MKILRFQQVTEAQHCVRQAQTSAPGTDRYAKHRQVHQAQTPQTIIKIVDANKSWENAALTMSHSPTQTGSSL